MKVYARASKTAPQVELYRHAFKRDLTFVELSPMEAYRLADELTDAADKLLSEQPGKFTTGPQSE